MPQLRVATPGLHVRAASLYAVGIAPSGTDSRLDLLYALRCFFAEKIELDTLIPAVIERSRELFSADGSSILLLDPQSDELYFPYVAEQDPVAAERLAGLRFPSSQGIAGHVIQSGQAVRSDAVDKDPRFFSGADETTQTQTGPLLAAPLTCRQSRIGAIEVLRRKGSDPFDDQDLEFLWTLASSVAVAVDNARRYTDARSAEQRLEVTVNSLLRDIARRDGDETIIGNSEPIRALLNLVDTAAAHPITVLISGETGTGKELVARRIHQQSDRRDRPFLAINCGAIAESLLESELFGHCKGSFTDANQDRIGVFEAASGGTLFLDEIAECPPSMQAKLLRVLQQGEIVRVGETQPRAVDVRIISASHCDLSVEVANGNFREDLFYRLSSFPVEVPPLRERPDDIPLLANAFVSRASAKHERTIAGIDIGAIDILSGSDWPGNIRQLQNELERAVILAPMGGSIRPEHLSAQLISEIAEMKLEPGERSDASAPDTLLPLREARSRFENQYLRRALISNGGNVSATARALGMSRFMVQKKIKEAGIK